MARALLIVIANAVFLVGVIWFTPIESLLSARGYTPEQIQALQDAVAVNRREPALSVESGGQAEAIAGAASENQTPPDAVAGDEQPAAPASAQGETESAEAPVRLIATDTVNLRAGQGTEHAVVGQVKTGDRVEVLRDPDGDWIRIRHDNTTGWVYRPLFRAPEERAR